jgi:hypothetical protein
MDPDVNLATSLIFDRSDRGPLRVVPSGVELDVDAKEMLEDLHRRLRSACRDAGKPPLGSGGGYGH